jgi:alkylation response protein AidB-like acyl-CoA dehydrogenase
MRKKLADKGWLTLAWPTEYGGQGASFMKQVVFSEEMTAMQAPGVDGFGIKMLGPTIMVHGTEEQKKRLLPPIARGELQWCQGYSEPDSGSDLASLQLKVEETDDGWVVNGSKIWTSQAHRADWIFFLGRTDPDAPKHRGISFFVADRHTPGIEVRPIVNMAGEHHFNQTIFEDVHIPKDALIGERDRGWYIAATLLDFERSGVQYPAGGRRTFNELLEFAKVTPGSDGQSLSEDPEILRQFAELDVDIECARLVAYEVAWMQSVGQIPNKEASAAKVLGTKLTQKLAKFGTELAGMYGMLGPGSEFAPIDGRYPQMQMSVVAHTIFAGTTEIQKNIIATRGLGLPRG